MAIANEAHAERPAPSELPAGCELIFGDERLERDRVRDDVDCVVSAVVGFAGIYAGYAALKAGKALMYANKESLVVGGDLLMPLARPGRLIPVDSEHSAIYQCLVGEGAPL